MNQHADSKEPVSGLTTLLALPMLWANARPERIGENLLDVLGGMGWPKVTHMLLSG